MTRAKAAAACRAETRSQGIATRFVEAIAEVLPTIACRAETRSQGIATHDRNTQEKAQALRLAEPRPVLRGLRQWHCSALRPLRRLLLQSRDPFSGDCDGAQGLRQGEAAARLLQSRDPFSGDCDPGNPGPQPHRRDRALAEPRPVLRGLRPPFPGMDLGNASLPPCRAETRSQGIATPPGGAGLTWAARAACRAETRSQGIATQGPQGGLPGGFLPPCRAETRSQGIATRWRSSGAITPEVRVLQSRDPFSGDCDAALPGEGAVGQGALLAEPRPVLRGLRP